MIDKIVYVTGCLGFMGSTFARNALQRGWTVYGVDKITYAANEDLLGEFGKYTNFSFERVGIEEMDFIKDCDYIVNFAAESHVENSIIKSTEFINSNIVGVKNLLDLVRAKPDNCVERPIFLHISTDEVYGDIENGSHTEVDRLNPSNPYSAAKASADMLVNAWHRTYGIEYVIMRPTNNYGTGQYPEKLIPLSIKNLLRGKKIKLHNMGTPIRNWLHVEDTSNAVMKIIDADVRNEIFNIAGGFEQSNIETVKKVIECFIDSDKKIKMEDYIDFSYNRDGQDVRYALDDSKLRRLGWKAQKNFDKEIFNITKSYKEKFRW